MTFQGSEVSGKTASSSGGIFIYSADSVTLQGSKVSDNNPNECCAESPSC